MSLNTVSVLTSVDLIIRDISFPSNWRVSYWFGAQEHEHSREIRQPPIKTTCKWRQVALELNMWHKTTLNLFCHDHYFSWIVKYLHYSWSWNILHKLIKKLLATVCLRIWTTYRFLHPSTTRFSLQRELIQLVM